MDPRKSFFRGGVGDEGSVGDRGMGLFDLDDGLFQCNVEDTGDLWDQIG